MIMWVLALLGLSLTVLAAAPVAELAVGGQLLPLPMIGGMARMGKWCIDSAMRRGTPKEDHENVITVYGGTDQWKQRVGFHDVKAPYLILLGPSGNVVWRDAESLDQEPYKALSSEGSRLLSEK